MKTTWAALAIPGALLIAAGILSYHLIMKVPRYRYEVLEHRSGDGPHTVSGTRDTYAFFVQTEHMGRFPVGRICGDLIRRHCAARCTVELWDSREAFRLYRDSIRDMPFSRMIYHKNEYMFTANHYVAEGSSDGDVPYEYYPMKDDMQYEGWMKEEGDEENRAGK